MRKTYRKSDLLREGYIKGLKAARKIIAESIRTTDGRTIANDARVWVDRANAFCAEEGEPAMLYINRHDGSTEAFEVTLFNYIAKLDIIKIETEERSFYITNARQAIYDETTDEISPDKLKVSVNEGYATIAEVYDAAYAELQGCPSFMSALPSFGSPF